MSASVVDMPAPSHAPPPAWVGGAPLNGDWRPTALAVAMLALLGVILFVEPLRRFAEMGTLSLPGYAMITLVVLGWAVALRCSWRLQLADRLRALVARVRRVRVPGRRQKAAG